jgi:hypothetical protein
VVLYTMVVGEFPFKGSKSLDIAYRVQRGVYRAPDYLSRDVVNLIGALLNKDPDERLTLEEALRHPWVTAHAWAPSPPAESDADADAQEQEQRGDGSDGDVNVDMNDNEPDDAAERKKRRRARRRRRRRERRDAVAVKAAEQESDASSSSAAEVSSSPTKSEDTIGSRRAGNPLQVSDNWSPSAPAGLKRAAASSSTSATLAMPSEPAVAPRAQVAADPLALSQRRSNIFSSGSILKALRGGRRRRNRAAAGRRSPLSGTGSANESGDRMSPPPNSVPKRSGGGGSQIMGKRGGIDRPRSASSFHVARVQRARAVSIDHERNHVVGAGALLQRTPSPLIGAPTIVAAASSQRGGAGDSSSSDHDDSVPVVLAIPSRKRSSSRRKPKRKSGIRAQRSVPLQPSALPTISEK